MDGWFDLALVSGLLAAALRMATPIVLAAMGELLGERAGVLNLGIEGTMLMGAVTGFMVTFHTGCLWYGVAAAAGVGALMGLGMALLVVHLGLNQHVSGLAVTLFASGLAMYTYRLGFGSPQVPPTVTPFEPIALPGLSRIPWLGEVVFRQYALADFAWLLVPLTAAFLFRTKAGLHIRMVGENPFAADTVGIPVYLTRTVCLAAGGALMGVGGAFLTLAHQNMFLMDVVGGRGWIAVAMVIFGNWNPWRTALGALIFGFLDGLQLRLQALGMALPFHVFLVIPYVMTVFAMIAVSRRAAAPAGLLKTYRREDRGG